MTVRSSKNTLRSSPNPWVAIREVDRPVLSKRSCYKRSWPSGPSGPDWTGRSTSLVATSLGQDRTVNFSSSSLRISRGPDSIFGGPDNWFSARQKIANWKDGHFHRLWPFSDVAIQFVLTRYQYLAYLSFVSLFPFKVDKIKFAHYSDFINQMYRK